MTMLICFYFSISIPIYSAESVRDSNEELFLAFKEKLLDSIYSGIASLEKINQMQDAGGLHNISLAAERDLAASSLTVLELVVPSELPHDTKVLLERSKVDISIGLAELGKAMNYYAKYIMKRSPTLYDKYIEKRDKGINYVDGGLTTMASARLRLDDPVEPTQNVWEEGKQHFYRLERAIPEKNKSNDKSEE